MRRSIEAVYRQGVLEPTEPLDLPEDCRLTLHLQTNIEPPSSSRFDDLFGVISAADAAEMQAVIDDEFGRVDTSASSRRMGHRHR